MSCTNYKQTELASLLTTLNGPALECYLRVFLSVKLRKYLNQNIQDAMFCSIRVVIFDDTWALALSATMLTQHLSSLISRAIVQLISYYVPTISIQVAPTGMNCPALALPSILLKRAG